MPYTTNTSFEFRITNEMIRITNGMNRDQSHWHSISFKSDEVSNRDPHLNQPGGALNANYTQVDAVARISAKCGELGLKYGDDFIWASAGSENVSFLLRDPKYATMLGLKV